MPIRTDRSRFDVARGRRFIGVYNGRSRRRRSLSCLHRPLPLIRPIPSKWYEAPRAGQIAVQISEASAAVHAATRHRHAHRLVLPRLAGVRRRHREPAWWSTRGGSGCSPRWSPALWIARLFVIGHDACHGSYTPSKVLNGWIGRIAFLPSLTPFSLWDVGHNLAHHGFTNLKGRDYVWTPYLAARVRAAPLDAPAARARLSQRRRPGRLLHDRDVVEEAVLSRAASTSGIGASATSGTACS